MMGMKKSVLVVLLAVLLIACAQQGVTQQGQQREARDFRHGTEGIAMSFVPNVPPASMYEGEPFLVMVELENRGTFDVDRNSGSIYLSGYDKKILTDIRGDTGLADESPLPLLQGRGPFVQQGGFDTVTFQGGPVFGLSAYNIDKYEPTVLVTACYKYKTLATAQVCVDPDPFAPSAGPKVCAPGSVSLGSQGAPVAVTNIELEPTPSRLRFKINIGNVGGGEVFKESAIRACSPYTTALQFDERDVITVESVTLSGEQVTGCRPLTDQQIRLVNGRATIFCEVPIVGESAYLAPLNVQLSYGYRSTMSKKVTVRATQSGR